MTLPPRATPRSTPRATPWTGTASGARPAAPLPAHLAGWLLPPEWRWGRGSSRAATRHYQEVVDALGRSLSLVTAPDAAHRPWLAAEARFLAHQSHPAIPTTYHYWTDSPVQQRGPGYLRRWISGETIATRVARGGPDDVPAMLQVVRTIGTALVYLHDKNRPHGAIGGETCWMSPTGRLWLLGWEWSVGESERPEGIAPARDSTLWAPEWGESWTPSLASDQWQLGALAFQMLTGEHPPADGAPPLALVRPDCPARIAAVLDQSLVADPAQRHTSVATLLRALERVGGARGAVLVLDRVAPGAKRGKESEEMRLRWATGDDYEVLGRLGAGTFGSVWRVRDLSLGREVAMKVLHPDVAEDDVAVARFRREAKLAAQLAHPAIVPIYDWETRDGISWYTMELAEGGSVARLVSRQGPQSASDIAAQVDSLLDALEAAHAAGIVHRDLKPENVLIDRSERWRLTDFGVAHVPGIDEGSASVGTPAFAAPEQLLGEAQGPASDLFAMGAVIAFTLSGRAPFGEDDPRAIVARQVQGSPDLEGIPAPIQDFLRRAMAPRADDRYPDAALMRAAWFEAIDAAERDDNERRDGWWRWLGGS
ncbi:MAG: serine/threonine-protein kinase [Gemmatimonadaceae bacterium]|nr:serine/threonine-protein kinase [Gemmatimonadaceae bacterium]